MTLVAGQLVALGVQIVLQQVLSSEQMYSWGWRIPFLIGSGGAIVVMLLRRGMDESDSFKAMENTSTTGEATASSSRGSLRVLLQYPRECLLVVGLTMGGTVAFYTYTTYMQKFMINTAGISKDTVAWINFVALLVFVVLQPIAGGLSDRIGRRKLLIFFGVAGTLLTVPIMTALAHTSNPLAAFGLMMVALVIVTGYTSINSIVKAELFPTKIRALGVGLPYALTVADVRWYRRDDRPRSEEGRPRVPVLLLRRRMYRRLAGHLLLHAGDVGRVDHRCRSRRRCGRAGADDGHRAWLTVRSTRRSSGYGRIGACGWRWSRTTTEWATPW